MLRLVKFDQYIYRGCRVRGLWIADEDDWALIEDQCAKKKRVNLGEIAGKYSDVEFTPELSDFEVVSTDQDFVAQFQQVVGSGFGTYVPRGWECNECGDVHDGECEWETDQSGGDM